MSMLSPPPGFPVHLVPVWPLIWLQILMLRAWVRATYGKGTQYHWSVTPCGRVFIASIDWIANQKSEPALVRPALHPNKRIAAALSGELLEPRYAASKPLSLGRGVGVRGRGATASAGVAAMPLPLIPNPFSRGRRGLPVPET